MSKEIAIIKMANSFFREGDFAKALYGYEKFIRIYGNQAPETMLESIRHNIDACRLRQSGISGEDPESHGLHRNRIALLVNPSHAHEVEAAFWSGFAKKLHANDYQVIDLNFRKVNPFENTLTFINPARMADLARKWPGLLDVSLPAWAGEELLDLYVDWEHRRWQVDRYQPEIRDGCRCAINYIDHLLRELNPAIVLTTNKIDPPNCFAYLAAKHYGVEYRFVERSPLNTYLLEQSGMFQQSGTCEDVISGLLRDIATGCGPTRSADRLLSTILGSPYGFREAEAARGGFEAIEESDADRPLFFLPLDNMLWTGWAQPGHPQGDIDYPIFRDPERALCALNKAVRAVGGRLVIKPHPSCKEWPRLKGNYPDLVFTESDLDILCKEADVIVTFLTKVAYLGLANRKPVVSFSGGLLARLGVTYEVKSESDLNALLRRALQRKDLNAKLQRFEALLPQLERRFCADGAVAAEACMLAVETRVTSQVMAPSEARGIVDQRPGGRARSMTAVRCANGSAITPGQPVVVVDVSRLLNARLRRSGISRYIYSLALELLTDQRVGVVFGYNPQVNEYGMSAQIFNELCRGLCSDLLPMSIVLPWLEVRNEPFVYHSPVNPLPECGPDSVMRKVLTIHDVFHLTRPDFYTSGKFITGRVVDSLKIDMDSVAFDSAYSMEDFRQLVGRLPRKSKVVHLAVDQSFRHPDFRSLSSQHRALLGDANLVCFPFQGDPRKGFERMLELAFRWVEKGGNRRIAVFGRRENKERLDDMLMKMGLDAATRLVFLPDLEDRDLAALYCRSIVQLYLSQAEGFGLPPMEAMASGCPSIMLANTSLTEVYEGWDLLLDNEVDDDTVLKFMERLTSDHKFRREIGTRARSFSDKFNWTSTANEMTDFYLSLLEAEVATPVQARGCR